MAELTVANYLGALQEDPYDERAYEGLEKALSSGEPARLGDDHVRHLEFARGKHEQRGEAYPAARLIEIELAQAGDDDPDFAAALCKELGRLRRDELMDDAGAAEAYERALALRPGDEEIQELLEQIRQSRERWKELASHFKTQAREASDAKLKASLLVRAASIVWQYQQRGKNKEVDKLFREALRTDPGSGRAVRLYEITLRGRGRFRDVAHILLAAIHKVQEPEHRLGLSLSAGRLFAKDLEDPDQAAEAYQQVLDFDPPNQEALRFLASYFTEREQWDHLVSLYEDVLKSKRLGADAEAGMLLQIAMVHWRMRGAPDKAEPYFDRLRKHAPAQPLMLEFYREHLAEAEDQGKLLSILSDAQRAASTDEEKLRVALELARLAAAREAGTERAIDAYKTVLRYEAANEEAHAALKDLYRKAGKWNALVETLRAELDAVPEDDTPRRLSILRELLPLYRDELSLDVMVLNTYNAILEADPADAEALAQLAEAYERMGRWNELIPVLVRKADASEDPDEQVELLVRVAGLWIDHFSNYNQATAPLERVLELAPEHPGALARLKEIYEKKRAWRPLLEVMRKELALIEDDAQRREHLIAAARLAADRLSAYDVALELWKQALQIAPAEPDDLDMLERLAERAKDWDMLSRVLEQRVELASDDKSKIKLLVRLGTTLGERAQAPARAAEAWKRVLEIDPRHGRALRTLRESFIAARDFAGLEGLYAESNDYEGLVDVLGTAAERSDDSEDRVALSFRAAEIYENELNAPERAFRAYERVLSVEPGNTRAARALLPLYRQSDKWPKVAGLLEVLVSAASEADLEQRLALLLELVDVCVERLRDGQRAFAHARAAYELAPEAEGVTERLERAVELSGDHAALFSLYQEQAEQAEGARRTALHREAARIAMEQLGRSEEAAAQLEQVLAERPDDIEASRLLERIYRGEGRAEALRKLLQRRVDSSPDAEAKRATLAELAVLEEELLDNADAAAERYRAILEIEPADAIALSALDRLAAEAGRHDELARVLRARLDASDDGAQRVSLLLRLGGLHTAQVPDVDAAVAAFSEVLEAEPGQRDAVRALERIAEQHPERAVDIGLLLEDVYAQTNQDDKLLQVLESRLSRSDDPDDRRALSLRVAEVATSLGQHARAFSSLEALVRAQPLERDLWEYLAEAAERADKLEELAALHAWLIDVEGQDDDAVVELAERAARIYDEVLAAPERAEPLHERVLAHDEGAGRAFVALKELYTNQERWDDLKALYSARVAYTTDAETKLDLLLQVCFLYEELLDDVDGAIAAYQEVLELSPSHGAARRALERLYTRGGRHRDLAALLEGDLADAEGKEAIELLFRLGELHEQKLGEPGQAVDRYAAVLDEQPTHLRAQEALERMLSVDSERQRIAQLLEPLYESQGAYPELVRVLEVQLEEIEDPAARVGILLRVASVIGTQLRDPEAAFSTLLRALSTDPADAVVREQLATVAAAAGRDRERAEALESALSSSDDPLTRVDILRELAALYDEQLADAERAQGAYRKLLDTEPENPDVALPAARALERLHAGAEDYPALAKVLRTQVSLVDDPADRRDLLRRLAELTETRLHDVPAAIAIHRQRLELDEGDVEALGELSRLYEATEQWDALIDVLRQRDQVAIDDDEARKLLQRIGEIQQSKLSDAEAAIATYTDVVSRFGPDRESLSRLMNLYERAGRHEELLETVFSDLELIEDREERLAARFRAAELLRLHADRMEDAVEAYREILADAPDHRPSVEALRAVAGSSDTQRVAAAETLVPYFETRQDFAGLVEMLEVAAHGDDVPEALACLRRAAQVAEDALGDPSRAFDLVRRAVGKALGEPDLAEFLDQLDRLGRESRRLSEYGVFLREVAPDVLDEELQLTCLMRAALTSRDHDGDVAMAREYFAKVLEVRPDHRPALDALERLHESAGESQGLLEVLRRKVEIADSADERVALLKRQAELCAGPLDDVDAALAAYEEVLEERPTADVFAGAEALYRRVDRFEELAAMYERQLDAEAGDLVEVRYELGALHQEQLGDAERALDCYRDVLDLRPNHQGACHGLEKLLGHPELRGQAAEMLEPVFLRRQDWHKLTGALEAQLEHLFAPEDRKPLLSRLAQLHEVQLEDLDGALEVHARMFRDDPTDEEVIETLERLARVLERSDRLAEILEAELEEAGVDDEVHVGLAVRAAELRTRTGDLSLATKHYDSALAFDPHRVDVAHALEQVLIQRGAHGALAAFYRNQADVAESDERRVLMLQRLAKLTEEQQRDPAGAVAILQEVLTVAPRDELAIEVIDRLLTESSRWEDLADHIRHCIEQTPDLEQALPLKIRLGGVLYERLDDVDGAIDLLEEITRDDPSYPPALQTLEGLMDQPHLRPRVAEILQGLYEQAADWQKLVRVFERRLEIEQDPVERVNILADIARQYEHAGKQPRKAFGAWARAFVIDPAEPEPREEVERLAEQLGIWDALVQAYERALGAASDDLLRASLLTAMAQVHDERRGDPRTAITTYERLLSIESDDPAPLDHLESLYMMIGDWRGLLDVSQRKLERSYDPVERAELARRAGSVLEELLNDPGGAIDAYRKALSEVEDDEVSLVALDRLYSQTSDFESLAEILQQRLQFAAGAEDRIDVAMRLGAVLSEHLGRRIEAIDAFVRVLEEDPGHTDALRELGVLYEREEMWAELLDNLRQRAELAAASEQRVELHFRAAQVLESKLRDTFEAIEAYRTVLEIEPLHTGAIEALMTIGQLPDHRVQVDELLEPLLREHRRWDTLAELLARAAAATIDPFERQPLLRKLAEVHEQGRGDLGAAFDTVCEALVLDVDEPQLADEVERLAAATSGHDRAADALAQRAHGTSDDLWAKELFERLARVCERELSDEPRAIQALVEADERSGGDPEVLAELDRLYTKAEAWSELAGILERRVDEAGDDARAADLLVRLGELRAVRFADGPGALSAYRDALDRVPLESRAVAAIEAMLDDPALARDAVETLEGVYRQAGNLVRVASLYDAKVRQAETPGERVALWQELASLWENDLGRRDEAVAALRKAFEADPLDTTTLDELERVAEGGAGFEALRGLVEPVLERSDLDRVERRELGLRAADWYRERLGDAPAAEQCLRAVLAVDPECSEAHEALTAGLREQGRTADLVAALSSWAEHESDPELAKERLLEAGDLAEQAGDIDTAVEHYKHIYGMDPGAVPALDRLIRIREAQSSWSHVAELLEHRIDAELDADTRVALRHRAAHVRLELKQDPFEAERLFAANLEDDPTDLASIDILAEIYEKAERWDDLRQLLERRLDVVDSVEERVRVRVRLASLAERQFGATDEAIEQLNEVVMDAPDHPEALNALERLLELAQRWEELGDLLERRIDQAVDAGDTAGELDLRVRQGELFEKHLERSDRAIDAYELVLEREPGHVGALRALVRLNAAAGEVARGAEMLEQLLDRVRGEELVETALQLAELAETQLDEPARAEQALRRGLNAGVRVVELRERLRELLARTEQFEALAEMVVEDVENVVDTEGKVALLREAADLFGEKLADPARAADCLERASRLVPDDRDVLLPLCDLYIEAGRQTEAIPVLEQIIASYGGRRAKEVATFHHRLGRAYLAMGDKDKALAELDAAFRIDLTNVGILVDLGVLCHQQGDLERAQKTFRALLLQKLDGKAPVTKADVYYYLGDIASQLDDRHKAVSYLERALSEQRDHDRAGQLLHTLKG